MTSVWASESVNPQRPWNVLAAELRRVRRRGGMPTGIIAALALGTIPAIGTLIVLRSLADATPYVVVTTPLELGAFLASLTVATATVLLVGRDGFGHINLALTLTPRRARLHATRAVAFFLTGAAVAATVGTVAAAAGVAVTDVTAAGWASLGVALVASAGGWLTLLAYGITTLVRRSGPAVLVFLGLLVLPLLLAALGGALPVDVAAAGQAVLSATPISLFMEAISVTTVPNDGLGAVLIGQTGLAAWALAVTSLAGFLFARRDA